MRPLGETQRSILSSLVEHKGWHGWGWGCGWLWDTPSNTTRLLNSLVKRGLAEIEKVEVTSHGRNYTYDFYRPTEAGRALAAKMGAERRAARLARQRDPDT